MSDVALGFPFTSGKYRVDVARWPRDWELIRKAQALRFFAFYTEAGISPPLEALATGLDGDDFDGSSDHLIVSDTEHDLVVGTYRLRRQQVAREQGGFYSATEFDLGPLLQAVPDGLLEVGRVCTHPNYRDRVLMQLFIGIAIYATGYGVTHLFGCGSFPGADREAHVEGLQFLQDHHLAPKEYRVRALRGPRYVKMSLGLPKRAFNDPPDLPPLIAFYRRLGRMYVGQGAVLDTKMNTTDAFLLVPIGDVAPRIRNRLMRGH